MEIKLLEIRDKMTFIPVAAMKVKADNPEQAYLLMRSGWGDAVGVDFNTTYIYLFPLNNSPAQVAYDPHDWASRTFMIAHNWLIKNWDSVSDGSVVDVEFILGETAAPKVSERLTEGL